MAKLSLNKAAKEASVAKSTLLEALKSGRMSAEKNAKGHWQIDPSELFRVFPKSSSVDPAGPVQSRSEKPQKTTENSALQIEVNMLREQIDIERSERERERAQLSDQIEVLREQAERQSADHRQALAALTDQREKRGFWARLLASS